MELNLAKNGLSIANSGSIGSYFYKPIEIKVRSMLGYIQDQIPGALLRTANRGRRSRWFFTRGTSTPVRTPMRLEAAECCQLTSTVPE